MVNLAPLYVLFLILFLCVQEHGKITSYKEDLHYSCDNKPTASDTLTNLTRQKNICKQKSNVDIKWVYLKVLATTENEMIPKSSQHILFGQSLPQRLSPLNHIDSQQELLLIL